MCAGDMGQRSAAALLCDAATSAGELFVATRCPPCAQSTRSAAALLSRAARRATGRSVRLSGRRSECRSARLCGVAHVATQPSLGCMRQRDMPRRRTAHTSVRARAARSHRRVRGVRTLARACARACVPVSASIPFVGTHAAGGRRPRPLARVRNAALAGSAGRIAHHGLGDRQAGRRVQRPMSRATRRKAGTASPTARRLRTGASHTPRGTVTRVGPLAFRRGALRRLGPRRGL
jgi:hypothetical protein